jgi:hypothetical protein
LKLFCTNVKWYLSQLQQCKWWFRRQTRPRGTWRSACPGTIRLQRNRARIFWGRVRDPWGKIYGIVSVLRLDGKGGCVVFHPRYCRFIEWIKCTEITERSTLRSLYCP